MRADRLISILLLLQIYPRLTARTLAERLEVSERTILRDMEALCVAGIPLFAERGTGGGWSLVENYRTNLTGLTQTEIQSLFLTRPARLLADLGLEKAADDARLKLLASLPTATRAQAEFFQQRIYVDATGWRDVGDTAPWLSVIQEAVWQSRKLRITYQRSDESSVERVIEPLGLVAKGSVWYLLAAIDDGLRNYRITRVRAAHLLAETFTRPPDFDLVATWECTNKEFKARFPRYPVTVRVHPKALWRVQLASRFSNIEQIDEAAADGWIKVIVNYQFAENACEHLISLGAQAEILEPVELRDKILALAQSVVTIYMRNELQ